MTGHKGSFWITAHEFTDLIKGACIGDNVSVIVNKLYRSFQCTSKQIINYYLHLLEEEHFSASVMGTMHGDDEEFFV